MQQPGYDRSKVREALDLLGIDRLVLAIHDASFPSWSEEDLGRGSPYSYGGRAFIRFAHELGFDGVQFGPQGQTSRVNPSPYDGTTFSRNLLSLAPGPEVHQHPALFSAAHLQRLVQGAPVRQGGAAGNRVDYAYAFNAAAGLLDGAYAALKRGGASLAATSADFAAYLANNLQPGSWLERDGIYQALTQLHGHDDWRLWPELDRTLYTAGSEAARRRLQQLLAIATPVVERYALGQFLLQHEHAQLQHEAAGLGLTLFGDLQVGYAHQDIWSYGALFLPHHRMGAPPSRTNPEGQPWGYPVLDPRLYGDSARAPGPALALVAARVQKLLGDFDGMRIDHPHGLICPWVYRADDPDPMHAVQNGARLFASPHLRDHLDLAPFAIVRPEQINPDPTTARHADDWVIDLSQAQVERYGIALDVILDQAQRLNRRTDAILCEVLSTWPRPLREVMERRGLGRFCVTQKANPKVAKDVYCSEHLTDRDWIMVGNHDTPPLWAVVPGWQGTPHLEVRAHHLAVRLQPNESARHEFAAMLMRSPRALCNAMFAELFASPARNVSIFFADLLGLTETYNRPGVHDDRNWTLRVPADYAAIYPELAKAGDALDLRRALAWALRAKAMATASAREAGALADALEAEAGPLPP